MKKIYIIKNDINDKKYIGQTSKQLEERMKQHIIDYKKNVSDYKKYQNIRIVSDLNNCHRDTIKYILEKNGIKIKQSNIISKEKMSKKVVQKDKNGNILNEFSSVTNAALYLGNINYISNIARVCNGIRKTCKGYIWEYI